MRSPLHPVACLCGLMALLLSVSPVLAVLPPNTVDLVVDTTVDSNAAAYQACTPAADDCSLRGAISQANAGAGSGIVYRIVLSDVTYVLGLGGEREDLNATGDLDVTGGIVTILGVDGGATTIDGNRLDRVLHVMAGTILEIHDLTLTGGETGTTAPYPGTPGAPGGGIYNAGGLIMRDCTVVGNATGDGSGGYGTTQGGDGGGIYSDGSLLLDHTTISHNGTGRGSGGTSPGGDGGDGGGLYSAGVALLMSSTIISNTTGGGGIATHTTSAPGGNGGRGGGIFSSSALTATGTTIAYNVTGGGGIGGERGRGGNGGQGGGLYATGDLTFVAGTIADNRAGNGSTAPQGYGGNGGDGGGVYSAGTLTIEGSTISGNVAGDAVKAGGPDDSHGGDGGGLCILGTAGLTGNTLTANRTGDGGEGFSIGMVGGNGDRAGHGGGIYNAGTLQLDTTTVDHNTTGDGGYGVSIGSATGGAGGSGGGIYNAGPLSGQDNDVHTNSTGDGGPADGKPYLGSPGHGTGGTGGDGGGIFSSHAITLTATTVTGNTTGNGGTGSCTNDPCDAYGGDAGRGGGVAQDAATLTLAYVEIAVNQTGNGGSAVAIAGSAYPGYGGAGGGISMRESTPTLLHTRISRNIVSNSGGAGIYSDRSAPLLVNATITGNAVFGGGSGGGVMITGTHPTSEPFKLYNVLLNGNHADAYGGGVYSVNSSPELRNTTLAGNVSRWEFGCAIYNAGNGTPQAHNTVIWRNVGGDQIDYESVAPTVQQSIVEGGYGSNASDDPLFVRDPGPGPDGDWMTWGDNDRGDLHLTGASPAIDAGSNAAVPPDGQDLDGDGDLAEPLPYDLDGESRFTEVPWHVGQGAGTPPLVDMGAYEYRPAVVYLPLVTKY